ncbi:unnamed protein product [Arctia plantaginis]|uniref:Uncharacterized protein n=1 Tax=Arctia plantaginis TaxID=874455 RepID=A0A8S1ASN5_ARCPL|nr:unnamed protein product [Arctia plantaginis]CAB3251341.1 unnamed protein product [Arctia plantaginis]
MFAEQNKKRDALSHPITAKAVKIYVIFALLLLLNHDLRKECAGWTSSRGLSNDVSDFTTPLYRLRCRSSFNLHQTL